ncbi:hypothetical protein [Sandaracinus amylolyticus]|uniref:hypothetical protein n=1 Tax=Sandaracinus amylolyticus TaxID=927083 RepID=UPI00069F23EB|nr:hypothetical protein [Sandaracinus amylolyticus]
MRHALVAGVLLLAACSPEPRLACAPGETRVCACPHGGAGARVCDGHVFGDCICDRALSASVPVHVGANDAGPRADASSSRDAGVEVDAALVGDDAAIDHDASID